MTPSGRLRGLLTRRDGAEIDTDPDKEHGKGDRDQIECANHGETQRRRNHKSSEKTEHHRQNDSGRAKLEPEDDQHCNRRQQNIQ